MGGSSEDNIRIFTQGAIASVFVIGRSSSTGSLVFKGVQDDYSAYEFRSTIGANSKTVLSTNRLTGATRFISLSADPASGNEAGDVYYNSSTNKLRVYNGSRWVSSPARPWDISNSTLLRTFSIAGQEDLANAMTFGRHGTRMYIAGATGQDVNEYSLITAWDVSTATFTQAFSVATEETAPTGLFFSSDGTKMYVLGQSGDEVNEYDLSTAWDVSTASYSQNFSVSGQDTGPTGLFFSPDGTKMYHTGTVSDSVHEYDLSTAWDITTASLTRSASVSAQDTAPRGVWFSYDGTHMYITGDTGNDVNEYALTAAWNISTATFVQSVAVASSVLTGLAFSDSGTQMFVVDRTAETVNQYWLA